MKTKNKAKPYSHFGALLNKIYYIYLKYVCMCMCVYVCVLSHFGCVLLFATLWTVAHQGPLSMEFAR